MKVKKILPNLFLFIFPNQFELCSTFFRLQEFYESPIKQLRGKYFTLEQAITYYSYDQKEYPEFTYFSDWDGFNVPGNIINKFLNTFKNNLSEKEIELLKYIPSQIDDNYYFIGARADDEDTLKHEIAHGLYYLNKTYKNDMDNLISQLPSIIKRQIKSCLVSEGYCTKVINDETQAYLATGVLNGMIKNKDYATYRKLISQFRVVFKTYFKDIQIKVIL